VNAQSAGQDKEIKLAWILKVWCKQLVHLLSIKYAAVYKRYFSCLYIDEMMMLNLQHVTQTARLVATLKAPPNATLCATAATFWRCQTTPASVSRNTVPITCQSIIIILAKVVYYTRRNIHATSGFVISSGINGNMSTTLLIYTIKHFLLLLSFSLHRLTLISKFVV